PASGAAGAIRARSAFAGIVEPPEHRRYLRVEEWGGVHYLILELVGGLTLAQRLARGPLPLDEALGVCREIVEALEAAHDRAIVHRDLKPSNVKVTSERKVKVLDFGLAKALAPTSSEIPDLSQSPTIT